MNIKRLNDYAIVPTMADVGSAGYDLYAAIESEITINAGTTAKIDTGWAMEIPSGYFGAIFARSGLATKEGLRPANCVGVIDSTYRGPVIVALHNDSDVQRRIEPKQRIAQLVIMPYYMVDFYEVSNLSDTARGNGGFGHSGK